MENKAKYIVRAFFSPDGSDGGVLAVGKEVGEAFINQLIKHGAFLADDRILADLNNYNYKYYRLYLECGAMVLLQDLEYSKQK